MLYNLSVDYDITRNSTLSLIVNNIRNSRPPEDPSYDGSRGFAPPYYNIFAYNGYGRSLLARIQDQLRQVGRHGSRPRTCRRKPACLWRGPRPAPTAPVQPCARLAHPAEAGRAIGAHGWRPCDPMRGACRAVRAGTSVICPPRAAWDAPCKPRQERAGTLPNLPGADDRRSGKVFTSTIATADGIEAEC